MSFSCNICSNSALDLVLSLPKYPLNTVYLKNKTEDLLTKYKPRNLLLYICNKCGHFQAYSEISLHEMYENGYNYHAQNSGVNGRMAFFSDRLNSLKSIKFNRVIDIGCFDLTLLKKLKGEISANYFIGIDPSIPLEVIKKNEGIICFKEYVDNVNLPYFKSDLPDLVISDQTFEHIPGINNSLNTIIGQVSKNSFFAVCVPSLEVLIERLNFHNIIHEHVNYFSIHTLTKLFENYKLLLNTFTIEYESTCGFLFALYSKTTKAKIKDLHSNFLTKNYFLRYYNIFRDTIANSNKVFMEIRGENIYGFGASDITPNLAYFMNTDFHFLNNILDDTDYKQDTFFPFLKPKIVSPLNINISSDSNCLITAPHAARYLYSRLLDFKFKKIINPIGLIS
jgi:hypothetical protein